MSSDKGDTYGSQVTFNDDGGRPQVDKYDKNSKLRPNDQVRILKPARTGVFTVREVRDGKCTLLDGNGALLDNGKWFEESNVELED